MTANREGMNEKKEDIVVFVDDFDCGYSKQS